MSNRAKVILLLLGDLICLILVVYITSSLRSKGGSRDAYVYAHFELFKYIFPMWFMIFFMEGLFTLKTFNPASLPISLLRVTCLNLGGAFVLIYLLPSNITVLTPKTNLVIISALSLGLLYFWKKFFFMFFSNSKRNRAVALVGADTTMKLVCDEIQRKPYLGYKIVQTIKTENAIESKLINGVEMIAIERGSTKDKVLLQQVFNFLGSIEIIDLAKFAENISGKIPINSIDETWFIEYCGHQESRSFDIIKTILDKSVAVFLIFLMIPVMIVLIPILLVFHGRPIFFKQTRTGLNNRPFTLYKLRSMINNAEKSGAQWARPGDSRITKLGKFLRKTRLDELPQLINILKGEMSLVGPRPERPEIISAQLAPQIPYYNLRHLVKPGVTGWAQVTFRYGYSAKDSMEKLQYDLYYVKNRNLFLDILVILKTIKTVLTGAGQ